MTKQTLILFFIVVFLASTCIPVNATTIDFEGLADSDTVTTRFPGLTFTNATVLTAEISLNEFEFPPQLGDKLYGIW